MRRTKSGYADGQEHLFAGELETGWKMPDSFPRLREAEFVSLDLETRDPDLTSTGSGFIAGTAEIIGITAIGEYKDGSRLGGYYPIRHERGENFPAENIFAWLRDDLAGDNIKVGANILYDLEGLALDGKVRVAGPLYDVQNAEGIIDEESAMVESRKHQGFNLDKLGLKYNGVGKNEASLKRCQELLRLKNIKGLMCKLPASLGPGEYAEQDGHLNLDVLAKQLKEIDRQNLGEVWRLECDLVPLLLEMRLRGVRVDMDAAETASKTLRAELAALRDKITKEAGFALDPWSSPDLARYCDANRIEYRRTAAGTPSFVKDWLKRQSHPIMKMVNEARAIEKIERDFVTGQVLNQNIKGRIHTQFNQLRRSKDSGEGEDNEDGTRSGRFSSTNPNLQQVPKRDDRFGPIVRALFVPDEGGMWFCGDYMAQEPRLTVHYAALAARAGMLSRAASEAAERAVAAYLVNPDLDYHQMVADMTGLIRKYAKEVNLGLTYGMGKRKLAWKCGFITEEEIGNLEVPIPKEVDEILAKYNQMLPFAKELFDACEKLAAARGYVRTAGGRVRHFDFWKPRRSKGQRGPVNDDMFSLPLAMARGEWPDLALVRAYTRKALNALIQGSAADMTKRAMVNLWRAGYVPSLTVHDEIDGTVAGPEQVRLIRDHMRDAMKLVVPVVVEIGVGYSWGEANLDTEKKKGNHVALKMLGEWAEAA